MGDKTSVLAALTANVMQEKQKAAAKLTPVTGEAVLREPALPHDTGLFMSNERLADHAAELRKFAAEAIAIADGLDAMTAIPSTKPAPVNIEDAKRAKERAADEKFAAEFADKVAAAQAATFTQPSGEAVALAEDMGVDESEAVHGWMCPAHGKAIEKTSPKTQRVYRACPDCNLFER